MKLQAYNQNIEHTHDPLWDQDVWVASDIGLKPDAHHGIYHFSFSNISTPWLKKAAMQFVRLQAATRSFSTCRGYIRSFNHFDDYLKTIDAVIVSRALIVGFIQHLAKQDLNPMTRRITLINLRTFHQIVIQEEWLDWPVKPIIFGRDLPRYSG